MMLVGTKIICQSNPSISRAAPGNFAGTYAYASTKASMHQFNQPQANLNFNICLPQNWDRWSQNVNFFIRKFIDMQVKDTGRPTALLHIRW